MLTGHAHSTLTDTEIIGRILNGEHALFELLVRRCNPLIYRIGRSHGFNHQDTEDLMQDAHVDAFLSLSKFEGRSAYKSWLARMMINRCLQRLRKSSFRSEKPNAEFGESDVPFYQSNSNEDPTGILMKNELKTLIENALDDIPVNYRVVFTLRELNGMSVQETAAALGITETNVKARLNRAKAVLRRRIEETFTPEDIYEFNLVHCDRITNNVMSRVMSLKDHR